MEIQVTLHVCHLAIPEVHFAALLVVILLHERNSTDHFSCLLVFLTYLFLKVLETVHHRLLISIESSTEALGPITLFLRFDFLSLELLKLFIDCLLLNCFT